jgi:hypothetical protein
MIETMTTANNANKRSGRSIPKSPTTRPFTTKKNAPKAMNSVNGRSRGSTIFNLSLLSHPT